MIHCIALYTIRKCAAIHLSSHSQHQFRSWTETKYNAPVVSIEMFDYSLLASGTEQEITDMNLNKYFRNIYYRTSESGTIKDDLKIIKDILE